MLACLKNAEAFDNYYSLVHVSACKGKILGLKKYGAAQAPSELVPGRVHPAAPPIRLA
jgi:hypothetical protein